MENQSKILFICTIIFMLDDLPLGKAMAKAQSSSFKTYLNRVSSFRSCLNGIFPPTKYSIMAQLNVKPLFLSRLRFALNEVPK